MSNMSDSFETEFIKQLTTLNGAIALVNNRLSNLESGYASLREDFREDAERISNKIDHVNDSTWKEIGHLKKKDSELELTIERKDSWIQTKMAALAATISGLTAWAASMILK